MGVPEGFTLTNLSNTPVAYGANGNFVFRVANDSLACTNASFGLQDPAPGVTKTCYYLFERLHGGRKQARSRPMGSGSLSIYGSGLNGNFLIKTLTFTVTCWNATFGGDPHPGSPKHCYSL